MAKTRPPYTPEFRRQMVELVRAGRSPDELAREFEPTAQSIRNWVAQFERDAGCRGDGLTTAEGEELNRLRRENRQLSPSGRSFQKPRPGSLGGRARCVQLATMSKMPSYVQVLTVWRHLPFRQSELRPVLAGYQSGREQRN